MRLSFASVALVVVLNSISALVLAQSQDNKASPPEIPVREIQVAAESFSRGDPVPAWVERADIPTTSRTDPAVLRLWDSQFRAGSAPSYFVSRAIQVNDSNLLAAVGQVSLEFVPQYQKLHLHSLRVLRGRDVLDQTSRVQVRFLQRELGLENGIYSGTVAAVLLVADLRVGDTVQYAYSIDGANPVFGNTYAQDAGWDWNMPVELRRVILNHPLAEPVQWKMVGDVNGPEIRPEISEAGGWRKLRFSQRGYKPEDVDRWVPKDFMPYRGLQFSAWDSWNSVARWANDLFPPAALPAELQARVAQWKNLPTAEQRAVAALQWVQDEIRYFSVSIGESSHRPHPPADVVRDRYGDCKDKTYLLVTLLRAMDLEATPVLTSLSAPRTVPRYLPSPTVFDHILVRLRLDGVDYYLDPTMKGQSATLARSGTGIEGAAILPVSPQTSQLETMHWPDELERNTMTLEEVLEISAFDSDATLSATWTWMSMDAEIMRVNTRSISEERLRKFALSSYERRYPGIDLAGKPVLTDDPVANRVTMTVRYKLPKPAKEYPEGWLVKYGASNMNGVYDLPQNIKRSFPATVTRAPYRMRYKIRIVWPSNVAVMRDPVVRHVRNAFFDYSINRNFRGNVLQTEMTLDTLKESVTPVELEALAAGLQQLNGVTPQGELVEREAIKRSSFLGLDLGAPSLSQTLRRRLQQELEAYDRAIAGGRLKGNDLVEALCRRAEVRADMDQAPLGLADAEQAVRLAPAVPRAWECRGHLLRDSGEFARSIPDYTRALALGGEEASLLQSRGISRFFLGKYDEALADFGQSVAAGQVDSEVRHYPMLWQGVTARRLGQPLSAELQAAAKNVGVNSNWPSPLLGLVAGTLNEDDILQAAQRKKGDDQDMALTEAWFFVGQARLAKADAKGAQDAFEQARKLGVTVYLEYQAAGWELQRMGKPPGR
ncbi:MAG: DUF3857 domain-containing protein [Herbaspirillum sp.]|nr:DUF3857 domain-containing protein [Herbaspirillum sp.]